MFDKKFINRFWSKVDIKSLDECWNWKAYTNRDGYGNVSVGDKRWNAHRVAYMIVNGKIKSGLCVCHKCDNPSCVNPKHLFLGTQKQNMSDKVEKGRSAIKRLSEKQKEYIRTSKKKPKELSKLFGVSGRTIANYK